MKEFEYVVTDPLGLHARPAGLLAREARAHPQVEIVLHRGSESARVTRLLRLMSLGVKPGDRLRITAQGPGEEEAIAAMEAFVRAHL